MYELIFSSEGFSWRYVGYVVIFLTFSFVIVKLWIDVFRMGSLRREEKAIVAAAEQFSDVETESDDET